MSAQPRKHPQQGIRTAVYCRISRDSEGTGLGVTRQNETCRALALAKGWDVDEDWLIIENDTSASTSKKRPGFERLIAAMRSGEVKAVVAYRLDRLVRRLDDLARLIDVARTHNVLVATVSGDLDLSTAQGRGFATLIGAVAAMEVDATSERIRARNQHARQQGRLTNGGARPYGWKVDRLHHDEREAQVIRDVTVRIIGGESLTSVCRDLNRRGVPTAGGGRWDVKKLRVVLSSARHAGRLMHAGQVVTGPDGRPVVAKDWKPILPPDQFDELQVALTARRVISDVWTGERRHLLSGVLSECGVEGCGAGLLPFVSTKGVFTYRCRGHLSRNRDRVDEYVLAQVRDFAKANPVEVVTWSMEERVDLSERISELEGRLASLEDGFVANGGDAARLGRMTAAIEAELAALREERLDRLALQTGTQFVQFDMDRLLATSASLLPQGTPEESAAKAAAVEEQRSALRLYVDKVIVSPTEKRGRFFDYDTIQIRFRDPNRLRWTATVEA